MTKKIWIIFILVVLAALLAVLLSERAAAPESETRTPASQSDAEETTPMFGVPEGFRGPTGPPRVVGPPGPPPDY